MPPWYVFVIIGVLGGISAGFFGIGGGIVIVPALIYWAGFSQHMATGTGTGTSIAVLLPPMGLAAAFEYHRHGNVDIRAAIILAVTNYRVLIKIICDNLSQFFCTMAFCSYRMRSITIKCTEKEQ